MIKENQRQKSGNFGILYEWPLNGSFSTKINSSDCNFYSALKIIWIEMRKINCTHQVDLDWHSDEKEFYSVVCLEVINLSFFFQTVKLWSGTDEMIFSDVIIGQCRSRRVGQTNRVDGYVWCGVGISQKWWPSINHRLYTARADVVMRTNISWPVSIL